MSVREKPVASRYLDLKEKERAYGRHVKAVATSRPTINTTQPDTPRRLMVAERNNAQFRRNQMRTMDQRDRMVNEVHRPYTSKPSRTSQRYSNSPPSRDTFRDLDLFQYDTGRNQTPQRPPRQPRLVENMATETRPQEFATPPRPPKKTESIKIGYTPNAIIEEQIIDDNSSAIPEPTE